MKPAISNRQRIAGRKRQQNVERETQRAGSKPRPAQSSRVGSRQDRGTDELRVHKLALSKREDVACDFPLDLMLARSMITPDEARAGHRYARVFWALYGHLPRALDPNALRLGRDEGPADEVIEDYLAVTLLLGRCSRYQRQQLQRMAVALETPRWLNASRKLYRSERRTAARQLAGLRRVLHRLATEWPLVSHET